MTERQTLAYQKPCWRAWETLAEEFSQPAFLRGLTFSSTLTVNK